MAGRKHNIGDMVRIDPWWEGHETTPTGIIVDYKDEYYVVKWFNQEMADGGYLWKSLKKV